MEIRPLQDNDYNDTLVGWWESWNWPPPPQETLPGNGTCGFIVSNDGVDICAGFLYLTNSSIGWCEFIISNKEYNESNRSEAIDMLLDTIEALARDSGCSQLYTNNQHNGLINRYKKHGYKVAGKNCTELIKIIKHASSN